VYVTSWQDLSPLFFLKKNQNVFARQFPFNHPRCYYFYYARSGIYHLSRKLKELGFTEVLFPAYHHGNEVKAMLAGRSKLIYYNIHPNGDIDYDDLHKKINKKTRVLYIIHYNGFPQDLDKIIEIKKQYNLILIEDAALSLFSTYKGKYLGEFGESGIFCLYKTFPIPNGGLLVINDSRLDIRVDINQPQMLSTLSCLWGLQLGWANNKMNGFGGKLQKVKSIAGKIFQKIDMEPTAVMDSKFDSTKIDWGMSGVSKFIINRSDVSKLVAKRRRNYLHYLKRIKETGLNVRPMMNHLPEGVVPFVFLVLTDDRETLFRELWKSGIEASRFWRVWHPDVPYQQFPEIDELRQKVLELPVHQSVTLKQIDYIIEKLIEISVH